MIDYIKRYYEKKGNILSRVLIIAMIGIAAYANSLDGEFVWDDNQIIKDNVLIKGGYGWPDIFKYSIIGPAGEVRSVYRPLQILSYRINYLLSGLDVTAYHLTNVLLHVLVALSLYRLLNLLFEDKLLSFLSALFFVAHPVHTQAVSYISGRADPLCALFGILSIVYYIICCEHKNIKYLYVSVFLYVLSVLSRENAFVLPFLILFYHFNFQKRIDVKRFLPYIFITLIYAVIRFGDLRGSLASNEMPSFLARIPGFFHALTDYVRVLIFPINLHTEYGNKAFHLTDAGVVFGVVIFIAALVYIRKMRYVDKTISFSIGWFFISLIPYAQIYPLKHYMAEHWLYMPSMGFFTLLSLGLSKLYMEKGLRDFAKGVSAFLLVFFIGFTIRQNAYWKKDIILYWRTLEYNQDNPGMLNNMAMVYTIKGDYYTALQLHKRSAELAPENAYTYNNMGSIYASTGDKENAVIMYKKAMGLDPSFADPYNNLAQLYKNDGLFLKAEKLYLKAVSMKPSYFEAYNNLGVLYLSMRRQDEAIECFEKVIRMNPEFFGAYNNLGALYTSKGQIKKAIPLFEKAIEMSRYSVRGKADYGAVHNNLAVLYYKTGDYDMAIWHCDRALEDGHKVNPDFLKLLEYRRKKR